MKMVEKKYKREDKEISEFLRDELPKERIDPWFTQKVLNRLPPRRSRHSIIEKWLVLITTLGALVGLVAESIHIGTAPVITVGDLIMMGAFMISFLILGCWIVVPLVKT